MNLKAASNDGVAYIGSLIGLIAFIKAVIPAETWDFLTSLLTRFMSWSSSKTSIEVNEFVSHNTNQVYKLVDVHVGSLAGSRPVERLELVQVKNKGQARYTLADEQRVEEVFEGHTFTWIHHSKLENQQNNRYSSSDMRRSYTLELDKSLRNTLLPLYLQHITRHAEEIKHKNRKKMLYTNYAGSNGSWSYGKPWRRVPFNHPSTFESMAMDPELKEKVKNDLVAFMNGEDYFRRIGRAWKRGYLLHGPPGTGKSSLIAAIAHFTDYDIYDLELTSVKSNSELREFLTTIGSKSIVVIEDIDCTVELKNRAPPPAPEKMATISATENEGGESTRADEEGDDMKSRVTLSGLLNFTDGLWSSVGSERIIIFTTNHIDQLDPALIRTGRMDMHICMSFCNFASFKVLAWTHLELREHEHFLEIEKWLAKVEMTPSDIAELLIQNRYSPTAALQSVVDALKTRSESSTFVDQKETSLGF